MDLKSYLSVLDNEHVSAALSIFLVVYAGMAAPHLPERVARLFENTVFRVLIFFLIAYTSQKNPTVAIIAAVGLMVSLQTLSRYDITRLVGMRSKSTPLEVVAEQAAVVEVVSEPEGVSQYGEVGAPLETEAPVLTHCDRDLYNAATETVEAAAPTEQSADGELMGFDGEQTNFAEV